MPDFEPTATPPAAVSATHHPDTAPPGATPGEEPDQPDRSDAGG
jgi:hypothetical protein